MHQLRACIAGDTLDKLNSTFSPSLQIDVAYYIIHKEGKVAWHGFGRYAEFTDSWKQRTLHSLPFKLNCSAFSESLLAGHMLFSTSALMGIERKYGAVRRGGIESDSPLLVHFNDLLEGVVTMDRDVAQLFVVARLPSTAA
jgi:hypothetical protein